MARFTFGAGSGDTVVQAPAPQAPVLRPILNAAATGTFWSAQTGGTQYTDLVDAVTGVAISGISTDATGGVRQFKGPDGVMSGWVDFGAGRRFITAYDGVFTQGDNSISGYVTAAGSATQTALDGRYEKFPARRVRYVDSVSGSDSNSGGSPTRAMLTIQAAHDSLAAMGSGGGRILCYEGLYAPVSITTKGITLQSLGSPSLTQVRTSSLTANGISITGASAASSLAQVTIDGFTIVGPGQASGGTGVGIYQHWTSDQVIVKNCVVTSWGSHGHQVVDSYSSHFEDVLYTSNGGDGFNGGTNFNNTVFMRTKSISNSGRGYAVLIGASVAMFGADAEGNVGAGYDFRYVTTGGMMFCHMEGNGTDGVSPNIYLHASDPVSNLALTRTVGFNIVGCLIQGKSGVTKEGLVIDGARRVEYRGNWFDNHGTNHVRATTNSRYTTVGPNTYDGTGTELQDDSGGYVQRNDYDAANVIHRVDALRFLPRSGNPIVGAQGNLWYHSTLNQLRLHDGTNFRTAFSGFQGSASLTFPAIAANSTATLTVTATGAAAGDSVSLAPPAAIEAGLMWSGFVSAANTVTIRLYNSTAASITPAVATWKVNVIRS